MSGYRDLPPALGDEIVKPELRPFLALWVDLPDPVAAWTGVGDIQFADRLWTGISGLAQIDVIGEGTDGSASGITATLNQVPSEFREDIEQQAVRGVDFHLYVGALDETFGRVVASKLLWKGTLQQYDVVDAGTTLTVTVGGESRAIDQRRPAIKVNTDEWQQRRYPGDRVFEYVPRTTEIPILWAKAKQDATAT